MTFQNPDAPALFLKGIEEFNRQAFFDAHETWEDLWRGEWGEAKPLIQGLIQLAVGSHHAANRNYKGALSQTTKGLEKLKTFPDRCEGIDLAGLRLEIERLREHWQNEQAGRAEPLPADEYPRIRLLPG
jgi:predicted metal-dependent hydrolase